MRRLITGTICLFAASALLTLAAGCGSACEDLAKRICNCQATKAKEDRCRINVDAAVRNFELSDEEESRCERILNQGDCNCEALAAGAFSACGLSADPAAVVE